MADVNDPAGLPPQIGEITTTPSEAVQPTTPEATATPLSIPVPPPVESALGAEDNPERFVRGLTFLDRLLILFLLVLAFLLGTFNVQNSDFWLHLATGRLLAEGGYVFGVDPFCYTTADVTWVNHAWLFDWGLYVFWNLAGDVGLVIARGLLVVVLALVLLGLHRPGQSLWLPVVCVTLALLTLSTRLLLQPVLVSLLFLALTLYLLLREPTDGPAASTDRRPLSALWLLPPLFALWVNLDSWFFLGPLTVALVLLGRWLQTLSQPATTTPGELRTLGLVLVVGLAACLLTPHLHRVFVLPPELAYLVARTGGWLPADTISAGTALLEIEQQDPSYLRSLALWLSPLSRDYWSTPARGLNVAGLAYFPLLLLSLLSFLLGDAPDKERSGGGPNWPRVLVLAVFALLSLVHARLLPFFAVVAGPITALNLQDWAAQHFGVEVQRVQSWRTLLRAGRLATALVLLTLMVLDWPGWLHGRADDPRFSHRVGWEVTIDPSLEEVARKLGRLHEGHKLGHGFNLTPDFAAYCAWFAPDLKGFYDFRFELFAHVGEEIGKIRRALRNQADAVRKGGAAGAGPVFPAEVQALFRQHGIDHLIFTSVDRDVLTRLVVVRLWLEPQEWVLLEGDGRTVVFGWKDAGNPERARTFQELAFDPQALAFGRREPEPPSSPRAFLEEPNRWTTLLHGEQPTPLDVQRTQLNLMYYNVQAERSQNLYQGLSWRPGYSGLHVLALAGSSPTAASPSGPFSLTGFLHLHMNRPVDSGPAGAPLLAVQAARRAIAAHPTDPAAYRALADAYESLRRHEDYWVNRPPQRVPSMRETVRRLQLIGALKQCLRLQPDHLETHLKVADIFLEMYYLDTALEHITQARALLQTFQPSADQAERFKQIGEQVEARSKNLTDAVKKRRDYYDLRAIGQGLIPKVKIALELPYKTINDKGRESMEPSLGLAQQALTVLREARADRLSPEESVFNALWQLRLLLQMGEIKEVREALDNPELKKSLGLASVEYQGQLAAVLGDYDQAAAAFLELERKMELERHVAGQRDMLQSFRSLFLHTLGVEPRAPLQPLPVLNLHLMAQGNLGAVLRQIPDLSEMRRQVVEMHLMRGLFALEHGDTAAAEQLLRETLRMVRPDVNFAERPIAARYLELLEKYRQRGKG